MCVNLIAIKTVLLNKIFVYFVSIVILNWVNHYISTFFVAIDDKA